MSEVAKNAEDYIPFCKDQGMPNLVGTAAKGVSIQSCRFAMVSGGVFTFAAAGLADMEDGSYQLFIHNHSDVADEGTVADNTRTALGFTIVGPDDGDLLDIAIIGRLKNQLA